LSQLAEENPFHQNLKSKKDPPTAFGISEDFPKTFRRSSAKTIPFRMNIKFGKNSQKSEHILILTFSLSLEIHLRWIVTWI